MEHYNICTAFVVGQSIFRYFDYSII